MGVQEGARIKYSNFYKNIRCYTMTSTSGFAERLPGFLMLFDAMFFKFAISRVDKWGRWFVQESTLEPVSIFKKTLSTIKRKKHEKLTRKVCRSLGPRQENQKYELDNL